MCLSVLSVSVYLCLSAPLPVPVPVPVSRFERYLSVRALL